LIRARGDRFDIPLFGAKQTLMPNTIVSQLCARESALHREPLSLCENPLKPFANVLQMINGHSSVLSPPGLPHIPSRFGAKIETNICCGYPLRHDILFITNGLALFGFHFMYGAG
jgi:hypothetical protein